jgi:fucose 4-O-acetylase-like acetyltransferase
MNTSTPMTTITLAVGAVLTVLGIAGFALTGAASPTALIPSLVGVLIGLCGVLARQEKLRRHAIHAALAIALLGALGSLMNVVKIGQVFAGSAERPAAVVVSTVMFVVLVAYIGVGVRSFIAARRGAVAS